MPTLLHISVFLFFAGLVDFLIPVNTIVAYFTLGWIAMFTLAYIILTILPNLFFNCPYRTPLSGFTWRFSQFSVLRIVVAIRGIEGLFHQILITLWNRAHRQVTPDHGPTEWRKTLGDHIEMHRKWLKDGLRKSVELSATDAPPIVDAQALEWTLTALDEDKEIEDFADRVPGFFDSRAVPDPTAAILPLMSDDLKTDPILGSRLRDLLKTCIPGTSPLTEEQRRSRLRVCLKSLWYCGRAYNQPKNEEPLPSYVRIVFASADMTHRIQTEEDPAARVIGRCFGALVAKKLSDDINLNRVQIGDAILSCLSAILDTESFEVMTMLGQAGSIELASIVSLTMANVDSLVSHTMPSDVLEVFSQTLGILSDALLTKNLADIPPLLIEQFHEIYSKAPNQCLKDKLKHISDRLPQGPSTAQEGAATSHAYVPQDSWTNISHGTLQSRENQVRFGGAPDSGYHYES